MSDEDDDGPVVFKRNNTISKQSNSRTQKSPSRKHEETEANVSGVQSIVKNCQIALASKMSSTKDPTPRSNSLTYENSKDSSSKNSFDLDTEERPSNMPPFEPLNESEDSEDYQPLSLRLSLSLSKGKSNNLPKGPISSAPGFSHSPKTKGGTAISHYSDDDILLASKLQPKSSTRPSSKLLNSNGFNLPTPDLSLLQNIKNDIKNDSEDEIPLSVKFHYKAALGSSSSKIGNADQKLPLASKISKADVSKDGNQIMKSSKCGPSKRCLDEDDNGLKYSAKKAKVLDATDNKNVKEVPKKSEPEGDDEDEDNIPIAKRMKKPTPSNDKLISQKNLEYKVVSSSLKETKKFKKIEKNTMYSKSVKAPPTSGEGQKWTTLVHNGVIFPPPYKPHGVKMLYEGKPVDLTPEQEEVATMFAVMKDTDYATKSRFIENFMNDWKKLLGKNHIIRDIALCDFTPIYDWHQREKEKKKQMSAEEKKILKEEKLKQEDKYMWAIVDGVKEKVGNFRVEPPGLFRGRGEHPKMGKLKRRISPSEITINIGKDAPIPECPIPGESWKEVKHDNTVTWLAYWNDPINQKEFKYVFLAASSALKGKSDKEKYEKARMLKDYIHNIRSTYTKDFTSKDISKQQIAVATYLIDKLALRAGNEKDDDEADTVGCCTLKVENVELIAPNKLKLDFLGKDSIQYDKTVDVELPVFKAIGQFMKGKKGEDDLFDQLDTSRLNAHLKELMPGLTAKVFRTYNASFTLDAMLTEKTKDGDVAHKVVAYQHANKEVAVLCNHQRSESKSHASQISRLSEKMNELKGELEELRTDLARAKKGKPPLKGADGKIKKNVSPEVLERKISQTTVKIEKIERDIKTKEDLKTVALGTSKINYCDPRITVAWCKRHEVPIEKIFNKSLLAKFAWAMDADPSFRF